MEVSHNIDEFEAIEAELKECLQELSNEELPAAENKVVERQEGSKENVNLKNSAEVSSEEEPPRRTDSNELDDKLGDHAMESEKVTRWRLKFQQRVQERDLQEEKTKKLWREKAAKDLDDFYRRQADSIHREGTQSVQEDEVGGLGDCKQNIWERVADLCDFDSKSKSVKDVSRMRSVILSLKNSSDPVVGVNSFPQQ
uniref:Clathrin light chain n=1 Tax=Lygus hesperus TaxID=30085 RepID=A0A0K8T8W8_LYGHE